MKADDIDAMLARHTPFTLQSGLTYCTDCTDGTRIVPHPCDAVTAGLALRDAQADRVTIDVSQTVPTGEWSPTARIALTRQTSVVRIGHNGETWVFEAAAWTRRKALPDEWTARERAEDQRDAAEAKVRDLEAEIARRDAIAECPDCAQVGIFPLCPKHRRAALGEAVDEARRAAGAAAQFPAGGPHE